MNPVLDALAIEYGVDYQELLSYFCDSGLGIGEITLTLTTLQNFEGEMTLSELVTLRLTEDMGWGKIWISLGLIGNGMEVLSQALVK
jgi:hypothetical protein